MGSPTATHHRLSLPSLASRTADASVQCQRAAAPKGRSTYRTAIGLVLCRIGGLTPWLDLTGAPQLGGPSTTVILSAPAHPRPLARLHAAGVLHLPASTPAVLHPLPPDGLCLYEI
jgi:hypothetical protein